MQKESDVSGQSRVERQAFSPFVKDQALKILDDYVLATGRKWQAIRSEIITVTGAEVSERAPIITRLDLESWAARKSTLGDIKFKLVFDFLIHPDTLARPEFSKAHDLVSFGTIERVGGALEDIFADFSMSSIFWGQSISRELDEETIERRSEGYEGCYTGCDETREYCLSVERFGNRQYFVCHFLSWPLNGFGEIFDWDIERYSGFSTIGNQIRLHLKGVIISTARQMYVVPRVDRGSDQKRWFGLFEQLSDCG